MKLELRAKTIKYFNVKKKQQGFTLIELLVVVIIIGVLAAIALPSFLNQTVKAKQAEAKNTIGAVNSSQTAFRVLNSNFASSMDELALGLPTDTANYGYAVTRINENDLAQISAQAKDSALKGYSGATERYPDINGQVILSSVICEASNPGTSLPIVPNPGSPPNCPTGMVAVGR